MPGRGAPTLQFVSGNGRTLSLELFFDTYEQQSDVRRRTDAIYGLLSIRTATHVPPVCTFRWAGFSFRGVVQQVSGRFTLFLADGTPVRATLTLAMREFVDAALEARRTPLESSDRTKAHTVIRGETLHSIATLEYGDPAQWRVIATASGIDDPLALRRAPPSSCRGCRPPGWRDGPGFQRAGLPPPGQRPSEQQSRFQNSSRSR